MIKVYFDLCGWEWNGKYFINLNVWCLEQGGVNVVLMVFLKFVDFGFLDLEFFFVNDELASQVDDDLLF